MACKCRVLLASILIAALLGGCTAAADDGADLPGAESIYEDDDPFAGGKADTKGLVALYKVEQYDRRHEARVVEAPVEVTTPRGMATLSAGAKVLIVRSLLLDDVASYLLVDNATFELDLVEAALLDGASRHAAGAESASWRYPAALDRTRNAVLCQLQPAADGAVSLRFALTIDMCQSRRQWEQGLFDWLVQLSDELGAPVKVGIAMTGLWANRHPDDFAQLVEWHDEGKLDISWINHSFSHQLSKDAQGHYHFMTDPSVDFVAGVMDLETMLLGQGVLPSALFRFPGLTHDARTLGLLNDLDLFPLDANGWLAKGEPLADRSVVLLHGNGNEKPGVDKFLAWAGAHQSELNAGHSALAAAEATLPIEGAATAFEPCAP